MNKDNRNLGLKTIACAGCLGAISIISTEFGIIGVLTQVASYYNIGIGQIEYLLSIFALNIFITAPFLILLASLISRKKMMLWALSLFLISNVVAPFVPTFWIMVFFTAAIGMIISLMTKSQQHKLMGFAMGSVALVQAIIILLKTSIPTIYNWQVIYMILEVITMKTLVAILIAKTKFKDDIQLSWLNPVIGKEFNQVNILK